MSLKLATILTVTEGLKLMAALFRTSPPQLETLLGRVASRDFTVGVMGIGYIGLPLALAALKTGFRVIGFDIDEVRVFLLNRGESGIKHIPSSPIAFAPTEKRFRATS